MKWNERSGLTIELAALLAGWILVVLCALIVATASHAYDLTLETPSKNCSDVLSTVVDPGAVRGVIDGDTFKLYLFGPGGVVKIRVYQAWTPEEGEPGYDEARLFTLNWLMQGPFRVTTCGKYTFERIVAIVERDGKRLADALIEAGLSE